MRAYYQLKRNYVHLEENKKGNLKKTILVLCSNQLKVDPIDIQYISNISSIFYERKIINLQTTLLLAETLIGSTKLI